jgi:hypothetical protein
VPGHRGLEGDEPADELARMGSKCPFIGPEPACVFSVEVAMKNLKNRNHKIVGSS